MFVLFSREREHEQVRGREKRRQRSYSGLCANSSEPDVGSDSPMVRSCRSQRLHLLRYAGAPRLYCSRCHPRSCSVVRLSMAGGSFLCSSVLGLLLIYFSHLDCNGLSRPA